MALFRTCPQARLGGLQRLLLLRALPAAALDKANEAERTVEVGHGGSGVGGVLRGGGAWLVVVGRVLVVFVVDKAAGLSVVHGAVLPARDAAAIALPRG
jgi:hypothetical protein